MSELRHLTQKRRCPGCLPELRTIQAANPPPRFVTQSPDGAKKLSQRPVLPIYRKFSIHGISLVVGKKFSVPKSQAPSPPRTPRFSPTAFPCLNNSDFIVHCFTKPKKSRQSGKSGFQQPNLPFRRDLFSPQTVFAHRRAVFTADRAGDYRPPRRTSRREKRCLFSCGTDSCAWPAPPRPPRPRRR